MENKTDVKIQTLALLVDNEPGVLSQISRLFSRKGYNIEAFAAGGTENPGITRITIDVLADDLHTELLCNQLRKLYPIHSVKWLDPENSLRRELLLIKVRAEDDEKRGEVIQIANSSGAQIIDISKETLTIETTDDAYTQHALEANLAFFEILEIARTGMVAMERGKATINDETKERGEFNYGKNVL